MNYKDHQPSSNSGNWLKLEQGDNKIRIISGYEEVIQHYDEEIKKSVVCIGLDNGCKYCQHGQELSDKLNKVDPNNKDEIVELKKQMHKFRPRKKYYTWAIDRKDSLVKLFNYGPTIQDQIATFAQNEEYAFEDAPGYDMNITKTGSGLETEYNVIPSRNNTELTPDELKLIEENTKPISEIITKMTEKVTTPETPKETGKTTPEEVPF